jgi:hypothetical protein
VCHASSARRNWRWNTVCHEPRARQFPAVEHGVPRLKRAPKLKVEHRVPRPETGVEHRVPRPAAAPETRVEHRVPPTKLGGGTPCAAPHCRPKPPLVREARSGWNTVCHGPRARQTRGWNTVCHPLRTFAPGDCFTAQSSRRQRSSGRPRVRFQTRPSRTDHDTVSPPGAGGWPAVHAHHPGLEHRVPPAKPSPELDWNTVCHRPDGRGGTPCASRATTPIPSRGAPGATARDRVIRTSPEHDHDAARLAGATRFGTPNPCGPRVGSGANPEVISCPAAGRWNTVCHKAGASPRARRTRPPFAGTNSPAGTIIGQGRCAGPCGWNTVCHPRRRD